jgi:hypothetical protein
MSNLLCLIALTVSAEPGFHVAQHSNRLELRHGDHPVATYVFRDETVRRSYYHAVCAPGGIAVTRHHPPREGREPIDHPTMHPGLWLAFGDLGGTDFWRNKGLVEHREFAPALQVSPGKVSFGVKQEYRDGDRVVCAEETRHTWHARPDGWLFTLDATFRSPQPVAFGDQEEMGLGLRVATPLMVRGGAGRIRNSAGGENERGVWGQVAEWCDYSGVVEGRRVGVTLFPHPENFRPSWFHARDYGLLVANPFGRKAFTKGEPSRVEIGPDRPLRLRFGVWVSSVADEQATDIAAVRAAYLQSSVP